MLARGRLYHIGVVSIDRIEKKPETPLNSPYYLSTKRKVCKSLTVYSVPEVSHKVPYLATAWQIKGTFMNDDFMLMVIEGRQRLGQSYIKDY